jgi:hypothetical protein
LAGATRPPIADSIGIGDRQHGNLGDNGRIFAVETLGVFGGSDAWGERIAREVGVIDASALHSILGAARAFGEGIGDAVAIVGRVGVDNATDSAVFRGDFGLDAAPGSAVTGDDYGAFDADAEAIQFFVIFTGAVVDVDQRAGHVAIGGVGVIGR